MKSGRKSLSRNGKEEILEAIGLVNALRDGETTVEAVFGVKLEVDPQKEQISNLKPIDDLPPIDLSGPLKTGSLFVK